MSQVSKLFDLVTELLDNGHFDRSGVYLKCKGKTYQADLAATLIAAQIEVEHLVPRRVVSAKHRAAISEKLSGTTHTAAAKAKISQSKYIPCKIKGVRYRSMSDAAKALNVSLTTISKRIKDPAYTNYQYLPKWSFPK